MCEHGSAYCNVIERVLGKRAVEIKRTVKGRAQLGEKRQRTAEVNNVALDRSSLSKSRNSLIDYRSEYACADIRLECALIYQRLDIAFCKNAAAGCNSIQLFVLCRKLVELRRGDSEQSGHLVYECARSSCTRSVHAHLKRAAGEKQYLGILTAELDNNVGAGDVHVDRYLCRIDLLNEVERTFFRKAHCRRTGD